MNYFVIDPEVAGGFGEHTRLDASVHPPMVKHLHYELDAWMGDDLVQTFPCYLATKRLWQAIEILRPSGVRAAAAEISATPEFIELRPDVALPELVWLKINGQPGKDDFALTADARLVVSERILQRLRSFNLKQCDVALFGS